MTLSHILYLHDIASSSSVKNNNNNYESKKWMLHLTLLMFTVLLSFLTICLILSCGSLHNTFHSLSYTCCPPHWCKIIQYLYYFLPFSGKLCKSSLIFFSTYLWHGFLNLMSEVSRHLRNSTNSTLFRGIFFFFISFLGRFSGLLSLHFALQPFAHILFMQNSDTLSLQIQIHS